MKEITITCPRKNKLETASCKTKFATATRFQETKFFDLELFLKRVVFDKNYTLGNLSYTGYDQHNAVICKVPFLCNTLELNTKEFISNVNLQPSLQCCQLNKTKELISSELISSELNSKAIDKGKYKVIVDFSQKFNRELPLLLNVPNRTAIRIHRGNSTKDTQGCILVGITNTKNITPKNSVSNELICKERSSKEQSSKEQGSKELAPNKISSNRISSNGISSDVSSSNLVGWVSSSAFYEQKIVMLIKQYKQCFLTVN